MDVLDPHGTVPPPEFPAGGRKARMKTSRKGRIKHVKKTREAEVGDNDLAGTTESVLRSEEVEWLLALFYQWTTLVNIAYGDGIGLFIYYVYGVIQKALWLCLWTDSPCFPLPAQRSSPISPQKEKKLSRRRNLPPRQVHHPMRALPPVNNSTHLEYLEFVRPLSQERPYLPQPNFLVNYHKTSYSPTDLQTSHTQNPNKSLPYSGGVAYVQSVPEFAGNQTSLPINVTRLSSKTCRSKRTSREPGGMMPCRSNTESPSNSKSQSDIEDSTYHDPGNRRKESNAPTRESKDAKTSKTSHGDGWHDIRLPTAGGHRLPSDEYSDLDPTIKQILGYSQESAHPSHLRASRPPVPHQPQHVEDPDDFFSNHVIRPITRPTKRGGVPARPGEGQHSLWDHSQLLRLRRRRIRAASRFHRRRRAAFARLVLASCRSLRATHHPRAPPDLSDALTRCLPHALRSKYSRRLPELLQELQQREVRAVTCRVNRSLNRYGSPGVMRVPWVRGERRALEKAMASFPPGVRRVMAHVVRPLDGLALVHVRKSSGVGCGEAVDLSILTTRWRTTARAERARLRTQWFPKALEAIREAATASGLSPSRRHAIMHAFNNLLASKLQEVLIRSIEVILQWLSHEEEPWVGPRVKLYLVLTDNQVDIQPGQHEVFTAFMEVFKELHDCVHLYRGTWEEPEPIPLTRRRAPAPQLDDAERGESGSGSAEGSSPPEGGRGGTAPQPRAFLEPRREVLSVTLSEPQWESFRTNLQEAIGKRFLKAEHYLKQIAMEWRRVLEGEVRSEVEAFMQCGAALPEYAEKVVHYSSYIEQASLIPASATEFVFRLEYKHLRQSLLGVTHSCVAVLKDKLISDHRTRIKSLSQQFEDIHRRVGEIPESTAELFMLMEDVEEARRISIHRLGEEVGDMTDKLKLILDVVHLTPDDLKTSADVIVWPSKLRPVLDRSVEVRDYDLKSLEDYKQQFEDTLVERAGEVSRTLDRINQLVTELEELADVAHVNKYIREVRKLEGRLEQVSALVRWVNAEESLFKFPQSNYPDLLELKECLVPYEELFTLVMTWQKHVKHWMDGDFSSLDPDFIDGQTEELARELFRLRKVFKTKFKQQALEGDPRKARMNLEDPNPNNLPGPLRVCALTLNHIKSFKEHLPLVAVLCNKGLRQRHWLKLNEIAGFDITPNAGTSLRKVVKMDLGGLLKAFEVVSSGASREYSLELSLADMRATWASVKVEHVVHPDLGVEMMGNLEEVMALVEEHLITTHTIKNSPFVGPFVDDVGVWEKRLINVRDTLDVWTQVQTLWLELTPVFTSPDLPKQMPKEEAVFKDLDAAWKCVMQEVKAPETLMGVIERKGKHKKDKEVPEETSQECQASGKDAKGEETSHKRDSEKKTGKEKKTTSSEAPKKSKKPSGAFGRLEWCLETFGVIQKAVHNYLNRKRLAFPRFFFLSNEELITFLCEKNIDQLKTHLRKCFDGVSELQMDENLAVTAVVSKEGEVLRLRKKVPTSNMKESLEQWLLQFQSNIKETLKKMMTAASEAWVTTSSSSSSFSSPSSALLQRWPLQVILTLRHVFWTADVHQAIRGGRQALLECLAQTEREVFGVLQSVREANRQSEAAGDVGRMGKNIAEEVDVGQTESKNERDENSERKEDHEEEASDDRGACYDDKKTKHELSEGERQGEPTTDRGSGISKKDDINSEERRGREEKESDVSSAAASSSSPSSSSSSSRRDKSLKRKAPKESRATAYGPPRHLLSTLILAAVQSRDALRTLLQEGVEHEEAFQWVGQLRLYLDEGEEITPRMLDRPLPWGWEYVGSCGRLVATPLTARAQHTLVTAYHAHLAAAPEGPAGTGKTETVKDLARTLALHCLVFNCSEGLDYISFRRFLSGVAAAGSWACFDEFNRLEIGVLSVVAQQLLTVVSARRENRSSVSLVDAHGLHLTLDPKGFMAVTLNPDYRGRVALPDNLKLLLRPVSMMEPDYRAIAEISLLSWGFDLAETLAVRVVEVLRACRLLLHPHHHYDFGMRALKAVLATAGRLRSSLPQAREVDVVLRALREVNQPKMVEEDAESFEAILRDFFPDPPPTPRPPNLTLQAKVEEVCKASGLRPTEDFLQKVIQLNETLQERHGVIVVGGPCVGKSTVIKVLADALSLKDDDGDIVSSPTPVNLEVLNPKTLTQAQLLGDLDPQTRDWSDGCVTSAVRKAHTSSSRTWLVLDGPADASWVEDLNTALDDSKRLCLSSGETIPLPESMVLLFEVLDLAQASPATVSRCGIIYLEDLPSSFWPALLHAHLHEYSLLHAHEDPGQAPPAEVTPNTPGVYCYWWWPEHARLLPDLAHWLLPPTLTFLKSSCTYLLPVRLVGLVRTLFPLTHAVLDEVHKDPGLPQKEKAKQGPVWSLAAFFFATVWALAGALDAASKDKFSEFFKKLVTGHKSQHETPESIGQVSCPFPSESCVFDVMFDPKQRSYWRSWADVTKNVSLPETTDIASLLVPTADTIRLQHLLSLYGRAGVGVLVGSEGGSGRRVAIKHQLEQLPHEEFESVSMSVTPATRAQDVQSMVLGRLELKSSGRWGAKGDDKRFVVFVDDLHLAAADAFMARPVFEVLREALQRKEWIGVDTIVRFPLEGINWIVGASIGPRVHGERRSGRGKGGSRGTRREYVDNGESRGDGQRGERNLLDCRCVSCFSAVVTHPIPDEAVAGIFTAQVNTFLRSGGFVPDIFTVVGGIVSGTLEALDYARVAFQPTPAQCHYLFEVNTAARVIHALARGKKDTVETKRHFVRLWVHELYRELCDRLTDTQEVTAIFDIVVRTIKSNFKDKIHVIFDKVCNEDGSVTESCLAKVSWGRLGGVDLSPAERRYGELTDAVQTSAAVEAFVQSYNQTHKTPLNLVVFRYAVDHVSRACRVLGHPGGHLLLVGAPGSGRRSLTRLAAHVCGHRLVQPRISEADDYADLRLELRNAVIRAGIDNEASVVLIGDTLLAPSTAQGAHGQGHPSASPLKHSGALHLVASLLATGEIHKLLPPEDLSNLMEHLRLQWDQRSAPPQVLWQEHLRRVRRCVHVVVTSQPTHALRYALTHYPALARNTTIDYYKPWPTEALEKVGEHHLENLPLRILTKAAVISAGASIHQTARVASEDAASRGQWCVQVTPASYLTLLQEFCDLYCFRQGQVTATKKKYKSGLEKLAFAASQISVMQETLESLGPQIVEATEDVARMVLRIEKESFEVEERRGVVAEEEVEAGVHAAKARSLQEECQTELNQALPALQEAVEALDTLKPADITVVKSMKNPPQAVKVVLAAVCVMLEIKPDRSKAGNGKTIYDFWAPSKRLLSDMNFLQQLRDYDKENIPDAIADKIHKEYLRLAEFDPPVVAKASSAAEGLCKWVRAMISYHEIAKIVAPKRAKLAEAEIVLAERMAEVENKRGELRELEEKLEALRRRYELSCREKEKLEAEHKQCTLKLERAHKMIQGLGGERDRWDEEQKKAEEALARLPGDTLLAAASLTYLPPHLPSVRATLTKAWQEIVHEAELATSTDFSLVTMLSTPLEMRYWGLQGLPSDSFSLENATIVKKASKCPMLVDPDDLGTKWIQNHERKRDIVVVRAETEGEMSHTSKTMEAKTKKKKKRGGRKGGGRGKSGSKIEGWEAVLLEAVTTCVPQGRPLLVLDLDEDPPLILDNLIRQNTTLEGGIRVVTVGNLTLKLHEDFRLYLGTRNERPRLSLEVTPLLTIINFTVTFHGLHDHLLQILVTKERPELEDERQELALTMSAHQKALQDTEDKILHVLATSQGNILESQEAINVLQSTKEIADDIKRKQEQCRLTTKALTECCEQYEEVSRPAATLYLTLRRLPALLHMYEYALSWYIQLYKDIIDTSGKSRVLSRRLALLQENLLLRVHGAVVKGLASPHQLPFTLLLALDVLRLSGKLSPEEEQLLCRSAQSCEGTPHASSSTSSTTNYANSSNTTTTTSTTEEVPRRSSSSIAHTTPSPVDAHPEVKRVWSSLCQLETLPVFSGFLEAVAVLGEDGGWLLRFLRAPVPKKSLLPRPWRKFPHVPWLLLMRALRPDKIVWAARDIIVDVLGQHFADSPPLELSSYLGVSLSSAPKASGHISTRLRHRSSAVASGRVVVGPSKITPPLLLVTAPGVDVLQEVMRYRSCVPGINVTQVSLGQGQSGIAESIISTAMTCGGWVILQNLHHALDWLPFLTALIARVTSSGASGGGGSVSIQGQDGGKGGKAVKESGVHPSFRLILTTQPSDEFPSALLRISEKVYVDAPGDSSHAFQAAIDVLLQETAHFELDDEADEETTARTLNILHGLSVFHLLTSERGRHSVRAWACTPSFTHADLRLAVGSVVRKIETGQSLDMTTLEYLIGRIFYGGRLRRPEDQEIVLTLLRKVFEAAHHPDDQDTTPEEALKTYRTIESSRTATDDEDDDAREMKRRKIEGEDVSVARLFPEHINDLDELVPFVQTVDVLDRPEVFGLPGGARKEQETSRGWEVIRCLALAGGAKASAEGKEDYPVDLILRTMKKLPKAIPTAALTATALLPPGVSSDDDRGGEGEGGEGGREMYRLLQREVVAYNQILHKLRQSLQEAVEASEGAGSQDPEVELVTKALQMGLVPSTWRKIYGFSAPTSLDPFFFEMHARVSFFKNWVKNGCPEHFWLGAFLYLHSFLVSILRQVARRHQRPLHHLAWHLHITSIPPPTPIPFLPPFPPPPPEYREGEWSSRSRGKGEDATEGGNEGVNDAGKVNIYEKEEVDDGGVGEVEKRVEGGQGDEEGEEVHAKEGKEEKEEEEEEEEEERKREDMGCRREGKKEDKGEEERQEKPVIQEDEADEGEENDGQEDGSVGDEEDEAENPKEEEERKGGSHLEPSSLKGEEGDGEGEEKSSKELGEEEEEDDNDDDNEEEAEEEEEEEEEEAEEEEEEEEDEEEEEVIIARQRESIARWNRLGIEGVLAYGLTLVGAEWDSNGHRLCNTNEQDPMKELPVVHLLPVLLRHAGGTHRGDVRDGDARGHPESCGQKPSPTSTMPSTTGSSQQHSSAMHDDHTESLLQDTPRLTQETPRETRMESKRIPLALDSDTPREGLHGASSPHIDSCPNKENMDSIARTVKETSHPEAGISSRLTLSTPRALYECPIYMGVPGEDGGAPVLTVSVNAGPLGPQYWIQRRTAIYLCRQ